MPTGREGSPFAVQAKRAIDRQETETKFVVSAMSGADDGKLKTASESNASDVAGDKKTGFDLNSQVVSEEAAKAVIGDTASSASESERKKRPYHKRVQPDSDQRKVLKDEDKKLVRFSLSMRKGVRDRLVAFADDNGKTVAQVVREWADAGFPLK